MASRESCCPKLAPRCFRRVFVASLLHILQYSGYFGQIVETLGILLSPNKHNLDLPSPTAHVRYALPHTQLWPERNQTTHRWAGNPPLSLHWLLPHLSTQLPGLHVKLGAALDTIQTQPPKGVKRGHENDNDNALLIFWSILAHDDNENDEDNEVEDGEDSEDNENNENVDDEASWINCWIDTPLGEGGCRNKEGCPGWGKPEILKTAGITGDQYTHYMVSPLVFFAVGLTDSISPRDPLTICVIATSTPKRHSTTTLHFTQWSMALLLKQSIQSYLFVSIHWQWGDESFPSTLLVPHLRLAHLASACQPLPGDVPVVHQGQWWPWPQIYEKYMNNQKQEKQKKAQQALKKCHVEPRKWLVLPGPKVSVCSPFSISDALKYQALNNWSRISLQNHRALHPTAWCRIPTRPPTR